MGSIGVVTSTTREEVPIKKGLIYGTAVIMKDYIDIDGYSNKKTEKGMLGDLARAMDDFDKGEADAIRNMIKFNEIEQVPGERGATYILEWEEVTSAYNWKNEDEYDIKPANYYVHVRFVK